MEPERDEWADLYDDFYDPESDSDGLQEGCDYIGHMFDVTADGDFKPDGGC